MKRTLLALYILLAGLSALPDAAAQRVRTTPTFDADTTTRPRVGFYGIGVRSGNAYLVRNTGNTVRLANYSLFSGLTSGYIPKWTGSLANSLLYEGGSGVGLSTTSLTGYAFRNSKTITGATTAYSQLNDGVVQSGVTTEANYYMTSAATQAASFTNATLNHFRAFQGTIGAGSAVTTQNGFMAGSSLVGATNNYGFRGSIPSGSGRWNLYMDGTAPNYLVGSLGIGTTSLTEYNLRLSKNITGATTAYGLRSDGVIQSDVVANVHNYISVPSTLASSFTLVNLNGFTATQGTFGAGSTVTNQTGFFVSAALIGATNNYGFRSLIPSGTNRWNLYLDGTAQNYIAGNLGIGVTVATKKLDVAGEAQIKDLLTVGSTVVNEGGQVTLQKATNYTKDFGIDAYQDLFRIMNVTDGLTAVSVNAVGAVGIGTSSVPSSALLDVTSTTKGVLFPRMTTTQRNAISSPAQGLVIFNTTTTKLECYDGTTWQAAW